MARMIFPDGKETTDFPTIEKLLARPALTSRHWPAPTGPRAEALMNQPCSERRRKRRAARAGRGASRTQGREGYATRDMVAIHENIPGSPT